MALSNNTVGVVVTVEQKHRPRLVRGECLFHLRLREEVFKRGMLCSCLLEIENDTPQDDYKS